MTLLQAGLERVNSRATSRAQTVRKWSLLPEEFTIAGGEFGEFTGRHFRILQYIRVIFMIDIFLLMENTTDASNA